MLRQKKRQKKCCSMKFNIDFLIPSSEWKLNHSDKFVLIGSCFSDEMESNFQQEGYHVMSNPFGTLFHPIAIARNLIYLTKPEDAPIVSRKDLYFNYNMSGSIFGFSSDEIIDKTSQVYSATQQSIQETSCLVVTFGTSWGYREVQKDFIVGNCHKVPQKNFTKENSSVDDMLKIWKEAIGVLKEITPKLRFIFTVSPVRHIKDGLVDNNRSKARLIQLCEELTQLDDCLYFPSYEIVIDELRDYRFYKKDRYHPNDESIDYVWERFKEFVFTTESFELAGKVKKITSSLHHKSKHPGSEEDATRLKKLKKKKKELTQQHPELKWYE